MKSATLEALIETLGKFSVDYLIVGGLAVAAHGYGRLTRDVDVVIALESDNIDRFFQAMTALEYRCRAAVTVEQFCDKDFRCRMVAEKKATVLVFDSPRHPETTVDVFVEAPFEFSKEQKRAFLQEIRPGLLVPFVCLETLLEMKTKTGRPQDLADVDELSLLHGRKSNYGEH